MNLDSIAEQRRCHIDRFVDSFVISKKAERYRSLFLNPKNRSKITDDLNHKIVHDLIVRYIVAAPPPYRSDTIAYLISDEQQNDDIFIEAGDALNIVASAYFGTIASIIPGVLAVFKGESPAPLIWLHRLDSK